MAEPLSIRRPHVVAEERFELPRGGTLVLVSYESSFDAPKAQLLLLQCKGFAAPALVAKVIAQRDRAVRQGPVMLFNDLMDLDGYDPAVREELTSWQKRNRARVLGTHLLLRSRLVAMGVQMASLALGQTLTTHATAASFERELRARVPGWVRPLRRVVTSCRRSRGARRWPGSPAQRG